MCYRDARLKAIMDYRANRVSVRNVAMALFGLLSFSLDLTGLMDYASTIFNSLSPIVVIIGGIILGLGLLGMVLTMITRAVKLHG